MSFNMYIDPDTYDLAITAAGNIQMTADDNENLAQKIEQRLSTFVGEWFLDKNMGVPYYERILKKNPNYSDVNTLLLTVVATTDGVAEVLEYSSEYDSSTREYFFNFTAQTEYGGTISRSISI